MNRETVEVELVSSFPELAQEEGFSDAKGSLHVVFGSYFCPWVEELLKSSPRSTLEEVELGKAFRFIERMMESGYDDLENVVLVTILNFLVHYCGRDVVARWCGPLSTSWLDRLPPP
jgi:hypothetical protein